LCPSDHRLRDPDGLFCSQAEAFSMQAPENRPIDRAIGQLNLLFAEAGLFPIAKLVTVLVRVGDTRINPKKWMNIPSGR
jgi:hypothetical protein